MLEPPSTSEHPATVVVSKPNPLSPSIRSASACSVAPFMEINEELEPSDDAVISGLSSRVEIKDSVVRIPGNKFIQNILLNINGLPNSNN